MSFPNTALGILGSLPEKLKMEPRHYSGKGASQWNKWNRPFQEVETGHERLYIRNNQQCSRRSSVVQWVNPQTSTSDHLGGTLGSTI